MESDADAMPYVPVDGAPWHLSMGLHRLDLELWLEVDGDRAAQLRQKASLLDRAHELVVVTNGIDDAADRELLTLVVEFLEHRGLARRDGAMVTDPVSGASVDLDALPALEAAARLIQEDLCVLQQVEGHWRLTSACVCFPSRWGLTEKLGQTLSEIHGPVPGFQDTLATQASTFFDRLRVERPVWRLNWTVLDTDELHLPSPAARTAPAETPIELSLWFRVERQTLRRLARTDAIVFTIRTYVTSLADLVERHPASAAALRDTLATVTPDVANYKGWTQMLPSLLDWLDERDGLSKPSWPHATA